MGFPGMALQCTCTVQAVSADGYCTVVVLSDESSKARSSHSREAHRQQGETERPSELHWGVGSLSERARTYSACSNRSGV